MPVIITFFPHVNTFFRTCANESIINHAWKLNWNIVVTRMWTLIGECACKHAWPLFSEWIHLNTAWDFSSALQACLHLFSDLLFVVSPAQLNKAFAMQNRELYSLCLCSYCCGLKGTGTKQGHRPCFQDDVKWLRV